MIQVSPELTNVINKAIQDASLGVIKIEVVNNFATAYVRSKAQQSPIVEEEPSVTSDAKPGETSESVEAAEKAIQDFIQGDIGVGSAIDIINALSENTVTLTEESVIADQ